MNGDLEVVRVGTYAHAAWADFYTGNKIYNFIPDRMTVFADWPPTDHPNLNLFANRIERLRYKWDESDMEDGEKRRKHELRSDLQPYHVRRHPYPHADIQRDGEAA